ETYAPAAPTQRAVSHGAPIGEFVLFNLCGLMASTISTARRRLTVTGSSSWSEIANEHPSDGDVAARGAGGIGAVIVACVICGLGFNADRSSLAVVPTTQPVPSAQQRVDAMASPQPKEMGLAQLEAKADGQHGQGSVVNVVGTVSDVVVSSEGHHLIHLVEA